MAARKSPAKKNNVVSLPPKEKQDDIQHILLEKIKKIDKSDMSEHNK